MNDVRDRNFRAGTTTPNEQLAREQAAWDDAAMQGLCEAGREEVVRSTRAGSAEPAVSGSSSGKENPDPPDAPDVPDVPDVRTARDSVSDTTVNAVAEPYEPLSPDSSLELSPLKRNQKAE